MFTLLTTVFLGILFAIFATQNSGPVTLNFGNYILKEVPIYLVTLVPLLIGTLLTFFLHLAKDLSQRMTINEDKGRIKNLKIQLAEITKVAHKLELENTKFRNEVGKVKDENSI